MTALVLCQSIPEAQAYGREIGESVRYASKADVCNGFKPSMIVELPSFRHRPDRHAINEALRRLQRKYRNEIPVRVYDQWTPQPKPVIHEGEVEGQLSIEDIDWNSTPAQWRDPEPLTIENRAKAVERIVETPALEGTGIAVIAGLSTLVANDEPPKPSPKKRTPRAEKVTKVKADIPAPPPGPVDDGEQVDAGFPRMPEFRWDD